VSWWSTVPMLAVTVFVMVGPGLLLALGLGFRRFLAIGVAPLFSTGIAGVAAVIGSLAGVPWSIWLVFGAAIVFSVVARVLTRVRRSDAGSSLHGSSPYGLQDGSAVTVVSLAGVALGACLIAFRTVTLIGNPENIAQRFDNVFHLNAVEWVVVTSDASTLTLGEMTGNSGAGAVYPAAWHSFAALVVQVTGSSVPVAVNMVNLVAASVVWPLSIVLLTRIVAGPSLVALIAAGPLSAAFIAFPYLLMVWGPLFPYMLSVALLPAALAVVLISVGRGNGAIVPRIGAVLGALVGVAALGVSHTSTVNSLLIISLPVLVSCLTQLHLPAALRRGRWLEWTIKAVMVSAALGLALVLWLKLRPVPYDVWGPHQTPGGAVGEVLTFSPMGFPLVSVAVSILAAIGMFYLVRRGHQRWILVAFALVGYLYIVDAGLDRGPWRAFTTGVWYADTNRLAALLPIFGVLLGAIGIAGLARQARDSFRRIGVGSALTQLVAERSTRTRYGASALGILMVAALVTTVTQSRPLDVYLEGGEEAYLRDSPTSILSSDEYAFLDRLDDSLPDDAVLAGNSWNGSTLAYAFTGREVLSHHLFETLSPAEREVADALRFAPSDAEACDAIRETRVTHVLDFGTQYLIADAGVGLFPGLDDLETSQAVRLVDEQGAAKLYEVVVCTDQ
jgi:hypothetical protein